MERRLIADYRMLINRIVDQINPSNLPVAVELARAAAQIAGYGPVKIASVKSYESRLKALLETFDASLRQSRAA